MKKLNKYMVEFNDADGNDCMIFIHAKHAPDCIKQLRERGINKIKDMQLIVKEVKAWINKLL